MEKKLVTLIIPCYNEEGSIPFLYPELVKVSAEISEAYDCEFIFVNDGSRDGTLGAIIALARQDDRVRYISFSRNFGKEAAMYAGFCNAKGDYVAIMDADLQHPPALLPKMLEILETQDYDSVATRRTTGKRNRRFGPPSPGCSISSSTGFPMRTSWRGRWTTG